MMASTAVAHTPFGFSVTGFRLSHRRDVRERLDHERRSKIYVQTKDRADSSCECRFVHPMTFCQPARPDRGRRAFLPALWVASFYFCEVEATVAGLWANKSD